MCTLFASVPRAAQNWYAKCLYDRSGQPSPDAKQCARCTVRKHGLTKAVLRAAAHLLGAPQHRGVCLLQLHAHVLADELRWRDSKRCVRSTAHPMQQDSCGFCLLLHFGILDRRLQVVAKAHLSASQCGDVLQVVLPVVTEPWRLHSRQLHACIKKGFVAPFDSNTLLHSQLQDATVCSISESLSTAWHVILV